MKKKTMTSVIIKNKVSDAAIYLFVTIYSLGCLVPFFWSIISSFKENDDILMHPFSLPQVLKYINYPSAWVGASMGMYFSNTAFYAVISTILLIIIASMASYIIARVKTSLVFYTYFTLGIMIPVHTILLPTFIMVRNLHLTNTRLSIILVYIAFNLSLSIFILVGFMKTLPRELEEAAVIDGCTRTGTFFRIILPLCKPGMATIGTLAFLANWNDYLVPLVLITDKKFKVLTQGVQDLRGIYSQDYGLVIAGAVISFIPVVIVYMLFQEQVIKGMTAGAVKG